MTPPRPSKRFSSSRLQDLFIPALLVLLTVVLISVIILVALSVLNG